MLSSDDCVLAFRMNFLKIGRDLSANDLTELPLGIFDPLTALDTL